jgi:RHS repeat-associated protein
MYPMSCAPLPYKIEPGTPPTYHFYFSDHLGSHSVVTNATGSSCDQDIDYYPYGGVEQDHCGTVGQHYKFTGNERDSESNLDNSGARYYGSFMGHFMISDDGSDQDARDPQSWNLYAYVRNNPLSNTDPTGNACVRDEGPNGLGPWHDDNSGGMTCAQVFADWKNNEQGNNEDTLNWRARVVFSDPMIRQARTTVNALGWATLGVSGGFGVGVAYGAIGGTGLTTLAIYASPLLPIVPTALAKLQQLGISIEEANAIVESPASQKLVDNLNDGNINVIQDVGGKLVRITLDPSGQRIISAGLVRARNIANGIASGRFTPQ